MESPDLVPLRTTFDVELRGFCRDQVRYYVKNVEAELELLHTDRNASAELAEGLAAEVAALRQQNRELRAHIDAISSLEIEPDALEGRLRRMVELANTQAAEILARADAAARDCWNAAEHAATAAVEEHQRILDEAQRERDRLREEHDALLQRVHELADTMTTEAVRHRKMLDDQAAQRRASIESDFEIAMAARRAEAVREIEEERAAASKAAREMVDSAKWEAARRIREANQELADLHALKKAIAGQLAEATAGLDEAAPLLQPEPPDKIPAPRDHDDQPARVG